MQNATFRTVVVVALLLGGLLVSYALLWGDSGRNQAPGFSYVVDLDFWRRTEREQQVKTDLHFDLAHDLIRLCGFEPDKDIEINGVAARARVDMSGGFARAGLKFGFH